MVLINAQDVASFAESSEIGIFIACKLSALDVIDMAFRQQDRLLAMNADSSVSRINTGTHDLPDLTRGSALGHTKNPTLCAADLCLAAHSYTSLRWASLRSAVLSYTSLRWASLRSAVLSLALLRC